jgi:hypothetical protein
MNGNSSNYKRTTPIDQLMDLDTPDIPEPSEPKFDPKFQKYLRGDVKSQFMNGANGGVEQFIPPPPAPKSRPHYNYMEEEDYGMAEHYTPSPKQMQSVAPAQINCKDFFDHVKGCPICSKFYNTDRTLYIIIIVILALVTLILLKRVLEK